MEFQERRAAGDPSAGPGLLRGLWKVVTRFLRRALSLEAAEKQYPKTFVSPYELEGTGIRADWPVIAALKPRPFRGHYSSGSVYAHRLQG